MNIERTPPQNPSQSAPQPDSVTQEPGRIVSQWKFEPATKPNEDVKEIVSQCLTVPLLKDDLSGASVMIENLRQSPMERLGEYERVRFFSYLRRDKNRKKIDAVLKELETHSFEELLRFKGKQKDAHLRAMYIVGVGFREHIRSADDQRGGVLVGDTMRMLAQGSLIDLATKDDLAKFSSGEPKMFAWQLKDFADYESSEDLPDQIRNFSGDVVKKLKENNKSAVDVDKQPATSNAVPAVVETKTTNTDGNNPIETSGSTDVNNSVETTFGVSGYPFQSFVTNTIEQNANPEMAEQITVSTLEEPQKIEQGFVVAEKITPDDRKEIYKELNQLIVENNPYALARRLVQLNQADTKLGKTGLAKLQPLFDEYREKFRGANKPEQNAVFLSDLKKLGFIKKPDADEGLMIFSELRKRAKEGADVSVLCERAVYLGISMPSGDYQSIFEQELSRAKNKNDSKEVVMILARVANINKMNKKNQVVDNINLDDQKVGAKEMINSKLSELKTKQEWEPFAKLQNWTNYAFEEEWRRDPEIEEKLIKYVDVLRKKKSWKSLTSYLGDLLGLSKPSKVEKLSETGS